MTGRSAGRGFTADRGVNRCVPPLLIRWLPHVKEKRGYTVPVTLYFVKKIKRTTYCVTKGAADRVPFWGFWLSIVRRSKDYCVNIWLHDQAFSHSSQQLKELYYRFCFVWKGGEYKAPCWQYSVLNASIIHKILKQEANLPLRLIYLEEYGYA